jgi:putative restriction endonuclease
LSQPAAAYPQLYVTEDQDPWTTARETDQRVRIAAFEFLRSQTELRGEVLPRGLLAEGFRFDGQRVPLIGPQGIFKPAVLPEMPLTITTVPVIEGRERPYEDEMDENGLLLYRYRGTDPSHRDNAGLRLAMRRAVPLIYLFGVVRGEYMPVWPVFIVRDNPESLAFSVAVDLKDTAVMETADLVSNLSDARRAYVTRVTQQRLHQAGFRVRVIRAYQERCTVCRLRHFELLDAAHILPDRHPKGDPTVSNGLALCKLHHAAFDGKILGVRPDLIVEIREDILREKDGPMLVHGLQGFQGSQILIPTRRDLQPDRNFLAERYEIFRKAG